MQELIKIDFSNDNPVVSARTLHEYLEVDTDYSHWFPRMCEYGFTEGVDFNSVKIDRVQNEGGRLVTRKVSDAALSIDMAKEICMIQRTERGKQARQYFIEAEKQWKNGIAYAPTVRMSDALAAMANVARLAEDNQRRLDAIEASTKELDSKLDKAAEAFTAPSFAADKWQENARTTIASIVQENGLSYQAYTGELYQRLESVACVNLKSRQSFKQKRMKEQGATYRDRQAVTKLNVIADDPKLRAVFDHILAMEKASRLMKGGRTA